MDPSNLTAAFGIWSAVVGIGCAGIVFELSRLRRDLGQMADKLQTLTVSFEHRLTRVEADILRCPANPAGFLQIGINGSIKKIPYYN